MVTRIESVPVPHHLPASCRARHGGHDLQVGIVDTGGIQQQLEIPDIVLPDHDLEIVFLEELVCIQRRLIMNPVLLEHAGTAAIKLTVNRMAA